MAAVAEILRIRRRAEYHFYGAAGWLSVLVPNRCGAVRTSFSDGLRCGAGFTGICAAVFVRQDLLNSIRTVTLVWNDHIREFVMDTVAMFTEKAPYDQRDPGSVSITDLTFSAADHL